MAFETGHLHDSALKGVINLIPKKNKDTRFVKNLRPITLLNTDYKLIEKMLALCIKPVLHRLIHADQQGFMQKRRISYNIRCILDILDYVNGSGEIQEGLMMSVDFEKAFDHIEIPFLLKALEFFNFHEDYVKWTKIIYTWGLFMRG